MPALSIILAALGFWALGMRPMMVTLQGEDSMVFAEAKGEVAYGASFIEYFNNTLYCTGGTTRRIYLHDKEIKVITSAGDFHVAPKSLRLCSISSRSSK